MSEEIQYHEGRIQATLACSCTLFLLALAIPVLALNLNFIPQGESLASWFQRSGSISVFLALFSEYFLFSNSTLIFRTGIWDEKLYPMRLKYAKAHNILSFLSFVAAICGTVIWGYGDLFISHS